MITRLSLTLLTLGILSSGCASMGRPSVLYIARHGQTEWNRVSRYQGDPDLDQVGYIHRVGLWHLLKDRPLAAIYTSQLLRTQRTAELVAKQHKLTPIPLEALNEIHSGIMAGICFSYMAPDQAKARDHVCEVDSRITRIEPTLKIIQAAYKNARKDWLTGAFPLAESYDDLVRRTAPFVAQLGRGMRDREVLVVSHGLTTRVLLHQLMGWPLEHVIHLRQENDQVYRLESTGNGQPRLSLYTPGVGWKICRHAPTKGQTHLDCNLNEEQDVPAGLAPAPASMPSGNTRP